MATIAEILPLARKALDDVPPEPANTWRARAAKLMRERTGLSLVEIVPAINRALKEPMAAADLPDGSVVADGDCAWFKAYPDRWAMANGLPDRYVDDVDVDEALKAGATVLRVGTGGGLT